MKPILYDASETEFKTQGLGRLSDTISCKVTENRNGSYELEMVYPVSGIHYAEIRRSAIICAKPSDSGDDQPFQIYSITRPMNGKVTIRGEHISYRMKTIPVSPFTASSAASALAGLSSNAAEDCLFEFWTDKSTAANFAVEVPTAMRSLLGGQDGSILDIYGGEWEFDGFTARLWKQRGTDNGVTIRYGKNLTDLKQEENIADTYTGIYPYWRGTQTSDDGETSEDIIITLDEKIVYSGNVRNFPYHRTIPVDFSSDFQSQPTQDQLRSAAQAYVKNNGIGVPSVSLTVSFIPLWQTEEYKDMINIEHVSLCDTVTVEFKKLGVSASAKVIKTVYDVLAERYDSIELGDAKSTLADAINTAAGNVLSAVSKQYTTKSLLQKSVSRASSLITGGLGGYVVTKLNTDGQPEELLILGDSPDYTTAQQVWRWNKNGLGYSSTGYTGEFRTAMTKDGHAVADFIDTGTLTANVIRTGLLTDVKGLNYWNLETGEFSLSVSATVGGSAIVSEDTLTENYYTKAEISAKADDITLSVSKTYEKQSTARANYATCSTSAGTATKVASCSNFELYTGAVVNVYFSYGNTVEKPTLNVNSTGAKSIYIGSSAMTVAKSWKAGTTMQFVYTGSYWRVADSGSISAIRVLADSISLSVSGGLGGTASITLSADGESTTKSIDLSKVRTAFKNDTTAITISAGTVTFNSNTFVVNSTYFSVTSTGVITASSGTIGGFTIQSSYLYSGKTSLTSNTYGVYVGTGGISVGSGSAYTALADGYLRGGNNSNITGYVGFNNYWSPSGVYGTRLAGRGCIVLLTNGTFGIGSYYDFGSNATITTGCSGSITFVSNISSNWKPAEGQAKWEYTTITFTKGLMTTSL